MTRTLTVRTERWPVMGRFTIARGSKTEAAVVMAEVRDGDHVGRGECVPYARYGESIESVTQALEQLAPAVRDDLSRQALQGLLPAGAARNALDCALWDLEAKITGTPVWALAGLPRPEPRITAYTLSLDTPEAMAQAARAASARPLLKIKLGAPGDDQRLRAIRAAAPDAELIIDANEGWNADVLQENLAVCAEVGVTLVEQPLPAADDALLARIERPVRVCADESAHDRQSLDSLIGRYDAINIKLDKTGGLTEAIALAQAAQDAGLAVMIGCMLATSLAMAPAFLLARHASVIDLDGPLLLSFDRDDGIDYEGSMMHPPRPDLWG